MKLGILLFLAAAVSFFFDEQLDGFGDALGGALTAFALVSMWVYTSRRWKRGKQKTKHRAEA